MNTVLIKILANIVHRKWSLFSLIGWIGKCLKFFSLGFMNNQYHNGVWLHFQNSALFTYMQ